MCEWYPMKNKTTISASDDSHKKKKACLSCGAVLNGRKRRYCSKNCKDKLQFALRWLKNLLLALNTKYATFSFSEYFIIINILPYRSKEVFSYFYKRTPAKTPADDLKSMYLEMSKAWYHKNVQTKCRMLASTHILNKGQTGIVHKDSIRPETKTSGSTVQRQTKLLKLSLEDIIAEKSKEKIKTAYRKEALRTHPDVGGDGEEFKIISEAYQELVQWLENPSFTIRRGLAGRWSYDGLSYQWRTPL